MSGQQLVAIRAGKNKYANIVWQISDVCNFRCSYCNEGNWGGKYPNKDLKTHLEVLKKLINHFKGNGYTAFKFFFSGGEPSYWPSLIPICDFLQAEVDRPLLAINTNLSRPLAWWQDHYHYFHDVVASFHVEFTKPERYLENIEFLQYRIPYLALRMLMHDSRFQEVYDFAEIIKNRLKNYTLEYAPLLEELAPQSDDHFYAEAWKRDFLAKNNLLQKKEVDFSLLKPPHFAFSEEVYADGSIRPLNSNRVVAEGMNQFNGWSCDINDNIFIATNGDISLASCGVGGKIGNINEGTITLSSQPVICPMPRCNCGTDICIPKQKLSL